MPSETTCDDCITAKAHLRMLNEKVVARLGGPTVLLCKECIECRLLRVLTHKDYAHAT